MSSICCRPSYCWRRKKQKAKMNKSISSQHRWVTVLLDVLTWVNQRAMATNTNPTSLDYDLIDLSAEDKVAAQKYLNENGIRGIEGFLAERLDAWRKWSVPSTYCQHCTALILLVLWILPSPVTQEQWVPVSVQIYPEVKDSFSGQIDTDQYIAESSGRYRVRCLFEESECLSPI